MSNKFDVFVDTIKASKNSINSLDVSSIQKTSSTMDSFSGGLTSGSLEELTFLFDQHILFTLSEVISNTVAMLDNMAITFENMDESIKF